MTVKMQKILLVLGIVAVIAALIGFWLIYIKNVRAPAGQPTQAGKLEVDFLDVGQGDAILIKTPADQNILIDGGPDNTVLKELSENLSWYDRTIDLMILTHPHDDQAS